MLMTGDINKACQQTRELSRNINWLEIHLPKWPQLASRSTCWHVLPTEALVGTHHCTSHRQSDLQLFPFQNQLRLYLAYTRPCPVHRGEARVNNAFSILLIYVWVRTVARLRLQFPIIVCALEFWNFLLLPRVVTMNIERLYDMFVPDLMAFHQLIWLFRVTEWNVWMIINGNTECCSAVLVP